ncbi:tetratricopeptide repeat protein [Ostreiculturibacter nitratireducens]|uniref:tetratricopeptide repeat protein n=1 Tax=Ostreiculturibacter nitratireducens TaxID=3075226 RepID=UPI0031B5649D
MPKSRLIPLAVAFGLALGAPASAQAPDGLAGPYLAARTASIENDYEAAATYFTRALIADPSNPLLLEYAIVAQVALGEVDRAVPIARQIDQIEAVSQLGNLVILADLAKQGDYTGALAELDGGRAAGPLVEGLFRAWALLGEGRMSDAANAFDKVGETEGLHAFSLYHKALALASVGDFEGADSIFSGEAGGPLRATRRGVIAHAQILSQLERNADAVELIEATFGPEPEPALAVLRDRLKAGEPVPFDVVTNAMDGLAEVFFTVAGALSGETQDAYTLSYSRLAEYLRADHVDAILLTADILEAQGQYDLATDAYNRIPRDDPAFHAAELGRANALIKADRIEAAIEVLQQLTKSHGELPIIWMTLGDTFRRVERYDAASKAYDEAIALLGDPQPGQWGLYYARGITHEREKRWPQAEADFRTALELSPDQPQVLNYLGYSYLEMKTNLDEALDMIERAVAARPEDGYITDSLGWALYRLGRYDEAVVQMERAIELMPVDPIVNDHLGDVYWAVGRHREAEFQWKRALSFEPETEEEAQRIRRKLEVGLDVVLQEEGAEPLAVSKNGN